MPTKYFSFPDSPCETNHSIRVPPSHERNVEHVWGFRNDTGKYEEHVHREGVAGAEHERCLFVESVPTWSLKHGSSPRLNKAAVTVDIALLVMAQKKCFPSRW